MQSCPVQVKTDNERAEQPQDTDKAAITQTQETPSQQLENALEKGLKAYIQLFEPKNVPTSESPAADKLDEKTILELHDLIGHMKSEIENLKNALKISKEALNQASNTCTALLQRVQELKNENDELKKATPQPDKHLP